MDTQPAPDAALEWTLPADDPGREYYVCLHTATSHLQIQERDTVGGSNAQGVELEKCFAVLLALILEAEARADQLADVVTALESYFALTQSLDN